MSDTHERITEWLVAQGFQTGWVLSGNEIVLWENDAPQPDIPAELLQTDTTP